MKRTLGLAVATAALTSLGIPWVGVDPARDGATIAEQLLAVDPTFIVFDSALPNLPEDFWQRWGETAVLLNVAGFPAFDTRVTHYLAAAEAGTDPGPWQNLATVYRTEGRIDDARRASAHARELAQSP